MSENTKRQPAGIPVGGQFAANEHDEAGSSLTVAASSDHLILNEGSSVTNIYPIGFPINSGDDEKIQWALDHDATLIVDMHHGTFPLSGEDLEAEVEDLASGEGFVIIGAYRNDIGEEQNPYHASAAARARFTEIERLMRSGHTNPADEERATALLKEATSTPEGKGDHYAAASSYSDLTPDAHARLSALMEEHNVSRGDVEREIANEFGMPVQYIAPDGEERFYQEHPNRIVNRISDDYLEEVVANAGRIHPRQDYR